MFKATVAVVSAIGVSYLTVFASATACLILELAFPRGRCSTASRLRAAKFWAVNAAVIAVFTLLLTHTIARLHVAPLFVLTLTPPAARWFAPAVIVLAPLLAAAVGDLVSYWVHRALHAVPFLWNIHRLHHSITELNGWTNIAHFFEGCLQAFCGALALAWVVHPVVGYVFPLEIAVLRALGTFQHACTRVHFGPLRYLFADNRYHRIHHSRDPEHYNRNFASFCTLWDQLFGTAYFPHADEWPDTGLADCEPPRSVAAYVLFPFQGRPQTMIQERGA